MSICRDRSSESPIVSTDDEVRSAALQFVRKVSGSTKPSKRNEEVFDRAVEAIAANVRALIDAMETTQPPKNREEEAAKAKARTLIRFA